VQLWFIFITLGQTDSMSAPPLRTSNNRHTISIVDTFH